MRIGVSSESIAHVQAEVVAVGVPRASAARKKALTALGTSAGVKSLATLASTDGFEGKAGQVLKVAAPPKLAASVLLIVGVGNKKGTEAAEVLSRVAAKSLRKQKSLALSLDAPSVDVVRAAAEGLMLGCYKYTTYKSKHEAITASATLLVGKKSQTGMAAAIRAGRDLAESINFARDLVNGPPNDINPVSLARIASAEAKKLGVTCTIWNKARIKKEKMNLFLAVNQGSAIEPRLIHVVHKPRNPVAKVVYVGKGLTFDAGGLCLKPAASMLTMKCDMAGAAATLGIVFAAARLKLPVEVHGIVGSTENMTGAAAYRPGDIYKSLQGKTVEIINTDAEGRLVLADVLAWASKIKCDYLIDHATLTGACMVALGPYTSALYTADDKLADAYFRAAERYQESFWRMPLDNDLRKQLNSPVADIQHCGSRYGGSITAALFLREFVGDANWMHLDIAGPAFLEGAHGRHPKGGTGFGVATGVRFLEDLSTKKKKRTTRKKR